MWIHIFPPKHGKESLKVTGSVLKRGPGWYTKGLTEPELKLVFPPWEKQINKHILSNCWFLKPTLWGCLLGLCHADSRHFLPECTKISNLKTSLGQALVGGRVCVCAVYHPEGFPGSSQGRLASFSDCFDVIRLSKKVSIARIKPDFQRERKIWLFPPARSFKETVNPLRRSPLPLQSWFSSCKLRSHLGCPRIAVRS